ncbi:MAG: CRISPR system precrRNA processing endoribonuclease RAMP protein Cas6 [Succinivibrio sp.]
MIDAVANQNANFRPNKSLDLTLFSFENLKKEAEFLLNLDSFTLELISPLRLSLPPGVRTKNATEFEILCKPDFFYRFEYALLHILNSLKRLGELEVSTEEIENLPKVIECDTQWCDIRYSKIRKIPLGGIIGNIKYEGKFSSYDLALRFVAGQYTGLGRNQRFGLGFYKIPELEIARSIFMPINSGT